MSDQESNIETIERIFRKRKIDIEALRTALDTDLSKATSVILKEFDAHIGTIRDHDVARYLGVDPEERALQVREGRLVARPIEDFGEDVLRDAFLDLSKTSKSIIAEFKLTAREFEILRKRFDVRHPKPRKEKESVQDEGTRLESLSGDGRSLELLSKPFKDWNI